MESENEDASNSKKKRSNYYRLYNLEGEFSASDDDRSLNRSSSSFEPYENELAAFISNRIPRSIDTNNSYGSPI